jgi:glucan 1,3-beta-glucosidase
MRRAYCGAQFLSYEKAHGGWFFWTDKTETAPEWSFRESVHRGWLPEKFG